MKNLKIGPLITSIVTPFDEASRVDTISLDQLLTHVKNDCRGGVLVTGITGEGTTLNSIERLRMWENVVDFIGEEHVIIASAGTDNTKTTIHNVQLAEEVDIDVVLLAVPYYTQPTQRGILAHFETVAKATHLPILIYHAPKRCGINLTIETTVALSNINNVIGIVDESRNLDILKHAKAHLPDDFLIFGAYDYQLIDVLKLKGDGIISTANAFAPCALNKIITCVKGEKIDEAQALSKTLIPLFQEISVNGNPAPVKSLLNKKGFSVGNVRLPMVSLSSKEQDGIWQKVAHLIE